MTSAMTVSSITPLLCTHSVPGRGEPRVLGGWRKAWVYSRSGAFECPRGAQEGDKPYLCKTVSRVLCYESART